MIAPEFDTGPFALALTNETLGKNLIAYRAWMSMEELIDLIAELKGIHTKCTIVEMDKNEPNEFVAGYAENMEYISEFGYEGKDDETIMYPREVCCIFGGNPYKILLTLVLASQEASSRISIRLGEDRRLVGCLLSTQPFLESYSIGT